MARPPDIKIRGIRTPIPSGFVLGRTEAGHGDVHLIPIGKLGAGGGGGGGGGGGNSGGNTSAVALNTANRALMIAGLASSFDSGGEDGAPGPPGQAGAQGPPGAAGSGGGGGVTIPGLDGDDGEAGVPIPYSRPNYVELVFVFDGSGASPPANSTQDLSIGFACTIISATLQSDVSGSCIIDVWAAAFSTSTPPTVANTITAAALPTLAAATGYQDTTLTGWTVSLPANTSLRANVNSASTLTRIVLTLLALKAQ